MARIKLGSMVVGIRGTIGGVVFSQNQSSIYAKQHSVSTVPRTLPQQVRRSVVADAANVWQTMTQAERDAWDTFAQSIAPAETDPFGDPYRISGQAWFVRSTVYRNLAGQSPLIIAPVAFNNPTADLNAYNARSTGATGPTAITYNSGFYSPSLFLAIDCAIRSTQGAKSSNIKYRFCLVDTNPPASQKNFQSELEAALGDIQDNQRVFIRVTGQDPDGYRSPALFASDLAN